jgi:hypothetical protein
LSLFDDPSDVSCPQCGTTDPIEIVYGLPSGEMMDAAEAGAIALGGCVINDDNPAYQCRNDTCGHSFGQI